MVFGATVVIHVIVFAHGDVTPLICLPYWITTHGLYPFLPCKLAKFGNSFITPRTEFKSMIMIIYWKQSVRLVVNGVTHNVQ